jgi:hypothetical protein
MIQQIERKPVSIEPEPATFDFTGTGFNLGSQINLLRRTLERNGDTELAADQVKLDLEGLWQEYINKSPVLPFEVELLDGKLHCTGYGARLADVTSDKERSGSVRKAVLELEKQLIKAKEGDLFLIISPPGWSGYPGINYPDTQIYCYETRDGRIHSRTLVLKDMPLEDLESLRGTYPDVFGKNKRLHNQEDRITSFTSKVLKVGNSDTFDVLDLIESHLDYDVDGHRQALKEMPEMAKGAQDSIQDLVNFIKSQTDFSEKGIAEIAREIGRTVIDLKGYSMWGRKPQNKEEYMVATKSFAEDEGCNGGGGLYLKSPTGDRRFEYEFNISGECIVDNCISPLKGRVQKLGPCFICESCSIGIEEGWFEPIYGDRFDETIKQLEEEGAETDAFFAICVLLFSSLFK